MRFRIFRWRMRLLAAVGCVTLAAGCPVQNEYVPPPPPKVTVVQPVRQDVTTHIEETGVTEAIESVEIRARVEGYLEEVLVQEGDEVRAGDKLFVIDKRPFIAERNKAAAALKVAEAEQADAEAKYRRAVVLAEKDAVSREELTEKAAAYEVAQATIAARRAELERAELELSYCDVTAPIAGRVGERLVDKGSFLGRAPATQLTTIIRYDPICASFSISERELLRLIQDGPRRPGTEELNKEEVKFYLAVDGEQGFPHAGHLDFADLGVEAATGTFRLRGRFPNPPPHRLTPGMTARIRMPTGVIRGALLIPEAAILADQRGRFVLRVNSEDRVERRDVRLGLKRGEWQVISQGLQPDDWVILEGVQFVRPGSTVEREPRALPPPETQGPWPAEKPPAAAAGGDAAAAAEPERALPQPAPSQASVSP